MKRGSGIPLRIEFFLPSSLVPHLADVWRIQNGEVQGPDHTGIPGVSKI